MINEAGKIPILGFSFFLFACILGTNKELMKHIAFQIDPHVDRICFGSVGLVPI